MLESATLEQIASLRNAQGVLHEEMRLEDLSRSTMVKVKTFSGNIYLFEMVDGRQCLAHVVRCEARPTAHAGYRGIRIVSPIFHVGETIHLDTSYTSPVTHVILLSLE